jgi:hypothetical protein
MTDSGMVHECIVSRRTMNSSVESRPACAGGEMCAASTNVRRGTSGEMRCAASTTAGMPATSRVPAAATSRMTSAARSYCCSRHAQGKANGSQTNCYPGHLENPSWADWANVESRTAFPSTYDLTDAAMQRPRGMHFPSMCADLQTRASIVPRYILVTCLQSNHRAPRQNPHCKTRNRDCSSPTASIKKSAHIADKNSNDLGGATVARMSHVPQIVSAVHNRPAARLIFAHLAGMFMVNVVAGADHTEIT